MRYRPEIDGLRAVAVLLVVLFHADGRICSGGYIGVDVFFVISGYLITSIISREIEQGKFSLLRFYERRARRILPAFLVVMVFILSASWYLVLPSAFKAVGRAAASSALSLSNVLFWAEDGYFAAASEEKPLLHTWSLGVEEQFYLLLPCLFLFPALRRKSNWIISSCFAVSLIASVLLVRTHPSAAFFLLPARAWELLLGSLVSVVAADRSVSNRVGQVVSISGLVAILWSAWGYTVGTAFPGENALLPCVGAAAVIYGSSGVIVGRFLSAVPFVFVGRISYSLYLWHWPILVFARQINIHPLGPVQVLFCILLSFVVATLSWKYVEQPFRMSTSVLTRKRVFSFSCMSLTLLAASGIYIHASGGVSSRFSAAVVSLDSGSFDRELRDAERKSVCWSRDDGALIYGARVEPRFAVLGDSHSNVIALKLGVVAKGRGESLRHFYEYGAAPLLGVRFSSNSRAAARIEQSVKSIESSGSIETVILVARWAYVLHGFNTDFGGYERDRSDAPAILMPTSERRLTVEQARDLFEDVLWAASLADRAFGVDTVIQVSAKSSVDQQKSLKR
jgi:peptidoglycan/LPS O-acetylase OafA/YrhL